MIIVFHLHKKATKKESWRWKSEKHILHKITEIMIFDDFHVYSAYNRRFLSDEIQKIPPERYMHFIIFDYLYCYHSSRRRIFQLFL